MSLSTHILDTMIGRPAAGVAVRLDDTAAGVTDADGRLALPPVGTGVHRLTFETGAYFAAREIQAFHPLVIVSFTIDDAEQHYHVPLLIGPYSYTTYRGS